MDNRLFFPATKRNRYCIGDVLSIFLTGRGSVLEIGSGSGEHGVVFQKRFPEIIWQTSDPDPCHRKSIISWIENKGLSDRMPKPIDIDVQKRPWPVPANLTNSLVGIICINMIHVSPWKSTKALFEESYKLLKKEQILMLYGPFKIEGKHVSESNIIFDNSLYYQNKNWGVRDLDEVTNLAISCSFRRENIIPMPSNNYSIIYKRL
tara:strand:+ start:2844 stop:3461 length:618 start_codon:yes stop_codon:yes gene_type:complete